MSEQPFLLVTHHGTIICVDPENGELIHRPAAAGTPNLAFKLHENMLGLSDVFNFSQTAQATSRMIAHLPLQVEFTKDKTRLGFKINGHYACAERDDDRVTFSRSRLGPWEEFLPLGINACFESKIASILERKPGAHPGLLQFHLGNYHRALELFGETSSSAGIEGDDLITYRRQILDAIEPPASGGPALMWRARPGWELDWLAFILPPLPVLARDTPLEKLAGRSLVIIDNFINTEKAAFYQLAYKAGCQITLLVCSDETFGDDHRVYRWCKSVFRNYFSPLLQHRSNVSFFALGYKTGFAQDTPPLPLASRTHVWSFAGDPNKTSRSAMLNAMRKVPGGVEHLISGFNAPDSLDTKSYRNMMENSVFIPCPQGFITLDSFRVYEALEAGCIPIVERRPNFDYFEHLLGPYPFPAVYDWQEVSSLIAHLQTHGLIDALAARCGRWWHSYKAGLRAKLYAAIFK